MLLPMSIDIFAATLFRAPPADALSDCRDAFAAAAATPAACRHFHAIFGCCRHARHFFALFRQIAAFRHFHFRHYHAVFSYSADFRRAMPLPFAIIADIIITLLRRRHAAFAMPLMPFRHAAMLPMLRCD